MNILLTGGTGLIGRALCRQLSAQGHQLVVLSRQPAKVAGLCGTGVRGVSQLAELDREPLDAVINLAGAPIADARWSEARKRELWNSRVTLTEQLVDWLGKREQRPSVLVSGSAVGWYGDKGEQVVDETSSPHGEYTQMLCDAWEAAARRAGSYGIRVCLLRTGLVLAPNGGFLKRLLPPFRMGLGGPIGNGQQYLSWVHIDDMLGIIRFLLDNPECRGPYNASAANPASSREFARTLGKQLHRPAVLPLPAPLLKLALGEMSRLLLTGQRVLPARLQQAGYQFHYSDLDAALASVLKKH